MMYTYFGYSLNNNSPNPVDCQKKVSKIFKEEVEENWTINYYNQHKSK